MAARLQAATASGYPVPLRTGAAAGHRIGTARSTQIEEEADIYTFLVDVALASAARHPHRCCGASL